jgi:hypothetical protein
VKQSAALTEYPPKEAAARLLETAVRPWTREFLSELERKTSAGDLERIVSQWRLSNAEAASIFGVTRQAFSKWLHDGVPPEREPMVADLAATCELLVRYVRPERIPAVVRRPASALKNRSLLEMAKTGDTAGVLSAVRSMFDLRRVQP